MEVEDDDEGQMMMHQAIQDSSEREEHDDDVFSKVEGPANNDRHLGGQNQIGLGQEDTIDDADKLINEAIQESLKSCKSENDDNNHLVETECNKSALLPGNKFKSPLEKNSFEVTYNLSLDCWKCNECSYTSCQQSLALQHLKNTHMNPIFPCNICFKRFTSRQFLSRHKERQHQISASLSTPPSVTGSNVVGLMQCPTCPEVFKCKTSMESHVVKCGTMSDFVCPICEKLMERNSMTLSRWKHKIQRHQSTCKKPNHSAKICNYCRKEFTRNFDCKRHMKKFCPKNKSVRDEDDED